MLRNMALSMAAGLFAAPWIGTGGAVVLAAGRAMPGSGAVTPSDLRSAPVARRFYEMALQGGDSMGSFKPAVDRAVLLLTASTRLDPNNLDAYEALFRLVSRHASKDYSSFVADGLAAYLDKVRSLGPAKPAIQYLLDQLDSRKDREQFLGAMLNQVVGRDAFLESELATLLGLLILERPDAKTARDYFLKAYQANKFNRLAFAKLAELAPDQISPAMYLEHLRLVIRENPMDIEAALALARYTERLGLYDISVGCFQYGADLYQYLNPGQKGLPSDIYLPWAISTYNSKYNQHRVGQIAQMVRDSGRFDIFLEALAGKAAAMAGDQAGADAIFTAAEQKAQDLFSQGPAQPPAGREDVSLMGPKQFAWFYSFARLDKAKALDWANRAYSLEPNSVATCAILAYALVLNDQVEWAKPLIQQGGSNQIAELALARVQLAEGQAAVAIETLKRSIERDRGSLTAEVGRDLLFQQGVTDQSGRDAEAILTSLAGALGEFIVPAWAKPQERCMLKADLRVSSVSYGAPLDATITLVNPSREPLVVSESGLVHGHVRIDVRLTGDVQKVLPGLISRRFFYDQVIPGGKTVTVPVRLTDSPLQDLLLTYPQASVRLEFTLTADPESPIRSVKMDPVALTVDRPKVAVSTDLLRTRYNSIVLSQPSEKVQTARLFIGLLREQHRMADPNHGVPYGFKFAEWMPGFLKSALSQDAGLLLYPSPDAWDLKALVLSDIVDLPQDVAISSAVAQTLSDGHWPVRMVALYALAKGQGRGFAKVLEWTARYDTDPLIRYMAVALSQDLGRRASSP